MRIKPFMALRPPSALAAQVSCPPYDVVDVEEARIIARGNPMCFLRVTRPEIELPEGTSVYDEAVYARAATNLGQFRERGYLAPAPQPALYLYRQEIGAHIQEGVVTVCRVEEYEQDVIKKHEKTRKHTEDDRTRHTTVINANAGPVFLTYRDRPEILELLCRVPRDNPLYDFTAPDRVRHTLWEITNPDPLVRAFSSVPAAYIADGHHRAASAIRVGQARRAANPRHTGEEEYNWFMACLFPAGQLHILPYNRCVKDLNGQSPAEFLDRLHRSFRVTESAPPQPARPAQVSMCLGGQWFGITWEPAPESDVISSLDVSVLQNRLLGPLLGIDDPRNNPRIEFVGGIRGPEELKRRVDQGRSAVAFSMYPTRIDQLLAVADAGQVMPPKSTWFEPKLRSGLLVHPLD